MKRIISVFILICSLLSLVACNFPDLNDNSINEESNEEKTENKNEDLLNGVVFGEKYIRYDTVNKDTEAYYIIEKDYITFHHSDDDENYTVTYKYTIVEKGMIARFYDSVEINDTKNDKNTFIRHNALLIVSENVISNTSGTTFIRESYLNDELKNFGKKVE